MQLTENQRVKINNFIEEIAKMPQLQGVARSNDPQKSEMYDRAYKNWFRGGTAWQCTHQGGTGQMRMIVWYQNVYKPKSKEWRPSIIIKAILEHLNL